MSVKRRNRLWSRCASERCARLHSLHHVDHRKSCGRELNACVCSREEAAHGSQSSPRTAHARADGILNGSSKTKSYNSVGDRTENKADLTDHVYRYSDAWTDTHRRTDRQTDRQTDRATDIRDCEKTKERRDKAAPIANRGEERPHLGCDDFSQPEHRMASGRLVHAQTTGHGHAWRSPTRAEQCAICTEANGTCRIP